MAVLLSGLVCPGGGQVYNGERRKGFLLVGLTLVLVVALTYVVGQVAMQSLPADPSELDLGQLWDRVQQVQAESHNRIRSCTLALLVLWVYGIVDAYRGARRARGG